MSHTDFLLWIASVAILGVPSTLLQYQHPSCFRYQAVPEAHLQDSLGLDSAALASLISTQGWTVHDSIVKITLNDDNTAKPKKVDVSGAMGNDQMTKILASIAS